MAVLVLVLGVIVVYGRIGMVGISYLMLGVLI